MRIKNVPLADLSVNSANDRHGELASEETAIEWLLTHRAAHMRNLTKDIVAEGRIYEPPLVHEDGGSYVVYDGNRRVTALKLLAEPHKAPSKEWADFFFARRSEWNGKFSLESGVRRGGSLLPFGGLPGSEGGSRVHSAGTVGSRKWGRSMYGIVSS